MVADTQIEAEMLRNTVRFYASMCMSGEKAHVEYDGDRTLYFGPSDLVPDEITKSVRRDVEEIAQLAPRIKA